MRHTRHERTSYTPSRRKELAYVAKARREREAFPLLATLIREQQPPVRAIMQQRATDWTTDQQRRRDETAAHWRRVRAKLASYGPNLRAALRHAWNVAPYPATWVYLGDMLHSFDQGKLVFTDDGRLVSPDHLTWLRNGGADAARRRFLETQAARRNAA